MPSISQSQSNSNTHLKHLGKQPIWPEHCSHNLDRASPAKTPSCAGSVQAEVMSPPLEMRPGPWLHTSSLLNQIRLGSHRPFSKQCLKMSKAGLVRFGQYQFEEELQSMSLKRS